MGRLSRRTLLVLPVASAAAACSLAQTDVVLEVEPDALSPFFEVVTLFARENDYESLSTGPGLLDFWYTGRHGKMTIEQFEPGIFMVVFEARPPEIWEWFSSGPTVSSIAEDFKRAVLRVNGVRVHETWPPPA